MHSPCLNFQRAISVSWCREFYMLKSRLEWSYPHTVLPFPEKDIIDIGYVRYSKGFIENRRHQLEHFLMRLAVHPEHRLSQELLYFLTTPKLNKKKWRNHVGVLAARPPSSLAPDPSQADVHALREWLRSLKVMATPIKNAMESLKQIEIFQAGLVRAYGNLSLSTKRLSTIEGSLSGQMYAHPAVRAWNGLAEAYQSLEKCLRPEAVRLDIETLLDMVLFSCRAQHVEQELEHLVQSAKTAEGQARFRQFFAAAQGEMQYVQRLRRQEYGRVLEEHIGRSSSEARQAHLIWDSLLPVARELVEEEKDGPPRGALHEE
mmetsp:Transcript_35038/g.56691  ORF Transcript_35038/g.56691 Transcript_35038/m.56691 type:complete len:318 (+) Transcript_35038:583-1536(+)